MADLLQSGDETPNTRSTNIHSGSNIGLHRTQTVNIEIEYLLVGMSSHVSTATNKSLKQNLKLVSK